MSDIGPSLPPHLLAKRKRKQEEVGQDAPTVTSGAKRSPSAETAEKRRKVAGPAMPPAPLDERPLEPASPPHRAEDSTVAADSSSDDDDDGFGPALPTSEAARFGSDLDSNLPRDADNSSHRPPAEARPQRDDWMTMPPEQDGLAARMDPTKQRARGFNTSKGAKAPPAKGGDSSAWHETPKQKRKRLEDEMMGISRPDAGAVKETVGGQRKGRDEVAKRNVEEHAKKHRGPSLMEQHKHRKPDEAEDDPSKRAFDREKDIGSGLLGRAERKDFLNKSTGFSSKFSGGSFL